MRQILLGFGLLVPRLAAAQQVSPAIERQIVAARDSVWRAWFTNDTGVLRRVLPGAAVAAEGGGEQWADRPAILRQSKSFVQSGARLERVDFANTHISLDGDVALVTSDYRLVTSAGQRVDTTRGHAAELFVRQKDQWVNPFWRLAAPAPLGREIPLPDTLGANFPISDSASKQGLPADNDAFVGVWEFRFQARNDNGAFFPAEFALEASRIARQGGRWATGVEQQQILRCAQDDNPALRMTIRRSQ